MFKNRINSSVRLINNFIFFLLFFAGFMWLIFGSMTVTVQGQGRIFAVNSQIINIMSPISGGYVKQVLVSPGDKVKRNKLLPPWLIQISQRKHVNYKNILVSKKQN